MFLLLGGIYIYVSDVLGLVKGNGYKLPLKVH